MLPADAAYSGTVKYGGFEDAGTAGVSPTGWSVYDSPWVGGFETSTAYAKEGICSLKTTIQAGEDSSVPRAALNGTQYWGYFDTTSKYELSVWVLIPDGSSTTGAYLLPSLCKEDGTTFYSYASVSDHIIGDTDGEWKKTKVVFKPERSFGAISRVFIRSNLGSTGIAYWDDLQLHKLNPDGSYADVQPETVYQEKDNILVNGDFSPSPDNKLRAEGWYTSGQWGVTATVQKNGDGDKAVIQLLGSDSPYVYQSAEAVGGEKLTLRFRYKTEDSSGRPVVKFSYRNSENITLEEFTTDVLAPTYGKWNTFTYNFRVPDGSASVMIYLRKYREENVYYSTARVYRTEAAPLLSVTTDNDTTFYYTDWGEGTAIVNLNTAPEGKSVSFYLEDGETVLCRQTKPAEKTLFFTFPISEMKKNRAYTLAAVLLDESGKEAGSAGKTIYHFERPKALDKKGRFTKNGETITPVFAYHVYTEDLADAKKAGINVVQGIGAFENGSLGDFLDICWYDYGIRVLVPLYSGNMLPAGHYVNRERTEAMILTYKDHPGLFGWMVQDEPFLQDSNNPEEVKQQLIESYRLIRTLDDIHPTYMTADIYSKEHYRDIGNCCDIIAPDDYALGAGRELTSVYANIAEVKEAVGDKKPIYALLQTFAYSGGRQPTISELRHMVYQSLLAGADAIGYFSFSGTDWKFAETTLYSELIEFNSGELPLLYEVLQGPALYQETMIDGVCLWQYTDGSCIGLNFAAEEREHAAILAADTVVQYGEATLTQGIGGVKAVFPAYGRLLGNCDLPEFGHALQISGTENIMVRYVSDGKKILPVSAKLMGAVYKQYGDVWEMTEYAIGNTEISITVPDGEGWKIVIMMLETSGGRPVYIKKVITSH